MSGDMQNGERGQNLAVLHAAVRAGDAKDWRRRPRPETRGPRAVGYCRWRGRLPIPAHAHPLVRRLFAEMNNQQTTLQEVTERAGLGRGQIGAWGRKNPPRLPELEAAFNVLGFRIRVEPIPDNEA